MPVSQQRMQEMFFPLLRKKGQMYEKYRPVIARKSPGGERIVTVTSSGHETYNTSKPGEYVVKNQTTAGEQYIVPADKFAKRYRKVRDLDNGHAEYAPRGRVIGIPLSEELLDRFDLGRRFRFEAPWGETEVAMIYDFLVAPPDFSEIYRIALREFEETYRILDDEEE